jgi:hypothetical protein
MPGGHVASGGACPARTVASGLSDGAVEPGTAAAARDVIGGDDVAEGSSAEHAPSNTNDAQTATIRLTTHHLAG